MKNLATNQSYLLDLLDEDQKNIKLFGLGEINKDEFLKRSLKVIEEFKLYINKNGFPFKNKESYDIYKAAFILSLHVDPEFLIEIGKIFNNAEVGAVDPEHKAYFIDKLRLNDGLPQLYGTQFKRLSKGSIEFLPIEKPEDVNVRRKEIGLSTLEEYKKLAEKN